MEENINNNNSFPDIYFEFDQSYNPTLKSPSSEFELQFYQTKESLMDIEHYKKFIDNAISRFRHSKTYSHYKAYLIDLGMDRCQLLPNIKNEDGISVEMHHNFLTIYDIALMICEHVINTTGYISTFDLVQLLKEEHKENRIPIVMLSKTAHQMFHNNDEMIIPAKACFGFWAELLCKYYKGITLDIANKVIMFITKSLEVEKLETDYTNKLLTLRNDIINWSYYNTYSQQLKINGVSY